MTDKTEMIIGLIQSHQEGREILSRLTGMVDVIIAQGEEGILMIAQERPDMILQVLKSMTLIMNRQQEAKDQLLEHWLSSMDNFDALAGVITKALDDV